MLLHALALALLCLPVASFAESLAAAAAPDPFQPGPLSVSRWTGTVGNSTFTKDALLFAPTPPGSYPVVVFQHGYVLENSFYGDILSHLSSWGFVVVAPQMYPTHGGLPFESADATSEVSEASSIVVWLRDNLNDLLVTRQQLPGVTANTDQLAIVGHSRGGKVAAAVALNFSAAIQPRLSSNRDAVEAPGLRGTCSNQALSAVAALDPVDGNAVPFTKSCKEGGITKPPLTQQDLAFGTPALILGTGLGPLSGGCFLCLCPCAPFKVGHSEFYNRSTGLTYHFVAQDYGHMDVLNDGVSSLAVGACRAADVSHPKAQMRSFTAGLLVSFLKAEVVGDAAFVEGFRDIREHPEALPLPDVQAEWKNDAPATAEL